MASKQAKPHILNRTIFTDQDNLDVLRGMNSQTVDLTYIDPPFNSKREHEWPIGPDAAGVLGFNDVWKLNLLDMQTWEILDHHHPAVYEYVVSTHPIGNQKTNDTMAYLSFMSLRLIEIERVLKNRGAFFLHCDPTESHTLKVLCDIIFGRDRFRNEIVWCYPPGGKAPKRGLHRKHDVILYYGSREGAWHPPYGEMNPKTRATFSRKDKDGRLYKEYTRPRDPGSPPKRQYLDETPGRPVPTWWDDIPSLGQAVNSSQIVGYPTQKPIALLKRIIEMASDPGDVVLDVFAGCATTPVAAELLDRRWIAADVIPRASGFIQERLDKELGDDAPSIIHRTDTPLRTDLGKLPPPRSHKGRLYEEQDEKCNGCDEPEVYGKMDVDHIIPRKHGGTDHYENLQLLCRVCHKRKSRGEMSSKQKQRLSARPRPIEITVPRPGKKKGKK